MFPQRILTGLLLTAATLKMAAADDYAREVGPFVQKYCTRCHNDKEARGELNLDRYSDASDVTADFRRWNAVIEFIRNGEMPPEESQPQPSLEERNQVVETLESMLLEEARKHAGDPGVILPRRLSNTEYDLSIRDLTGVDIRPTREFPADPAAGEGFDNTGEALAISPSMVRKYLAAAEHVSHHLVLRTNGLSFAPFPVTSYNERKKLTEQAIIDFYKQHEVRLRDYVTAAWRYRQRSGADRKTSIDVWAARAGLSGRYLRLVSETLNRAASGAGYVRLVGEQWNALPPSGSGESVPAELNALVRLIEFCQMRLGYARQGLIKSNAGNWPIGHLDFRARVAGQRDQFNPDGFATSHFIRFDRLQKPKNNDKSGQSLYLRIDPAFETSKGNYVVLKKPLLSKSGNLPRNEDDEKKNEVETLHSFLKRHAADVARTLRFGRHPRGHDIDPDSIVVEAPGVIEIPLSPELLTRLHGKHLLVQCELDPEHGREGSVHIQHSSRERPHDAYSTNAALLIHRDSEFARAMAESAEEFCHTFPNRFFYVDDRRGLAAGFHLVEGFFRDDQPLVEKVLNEQQRQELDRLWDELDFVTNSAETLIRGFVWFERSERHVLHDKRFDFLRPEDPLLVKEEMLGRFERVYLDRLGVDLLEEQLKPEKPDPKFDMIHGFFDDIRDGLSRRQELLKQSEPLALDQLAQLAQRAYHRPLRDGEKTSLQRLYQTLRDQGQDVESALRGVFTAILMSPDFCYRYNDAEPGSDVRAIADNALASRLSYFLWSSLPDELLLKAAGDGTLSSESQLRIQTRRMLKDSRINSLAREFPGQWLRYRDFLANDSINAETFRGYDDELRQAMFDEPTRLVTWLIQQDRPITDLLNSDTTFVNGTLANHYGGDIAAQFRRHAAEWNDGYRRKGVVPPVPPEQVWHRVDGLKAQGRGGLFGMAVVLAKNSAGERTSPVKRGFWAVHHLLGQHFPPPPADVAELPPNEKDAEQTIRQLIVQHTANPRCAMCHVHFDGVGLAMEGFDPIGRARTRDLAGRTIDDIASLPNGETARGIPGLIEYMENHRRDDFVRTFCRKFLGYALGRSVLLSDQPLLNDMAEGLRKNDYRFSVLFEMVVTSPQFRNQRGSEFVATNR